LSIEYLLLPSTSITNLISSLLTFEIEGIINKKFVDKLEGNSQ